MEDRHRQFADLYLADPTRNATRAYLQIYPGSSQAAAYSSASALLKHPRMVVYLAEREEELTKAAKLEQCYVLEGLKEIVQVGRVALEIKNDKEGGIKYRRMVDAGNAARALELLGKTQKMFVDRVESEVTHRFQFMVKK
jgi:phage terminase small subunit